MCYAKEECFLEISGDQYHYGPSKKTIEMYSGLPFFNKIDNRFIDDERVLSEGIAEKNQIGWRNVEVPGKFYDSDYDANKDELYIGDMIYINAKGDVLLCCDLSYIHQKKHIIGNILREPLEAILMRKMDIADKISA